MLTSEFKIINKIFKEELNTERVKQHISFANNLRLFLEFIIKSNISLPKREYSISNNLLFYHARIYIIENHPKYYKELERMFHKNEIHVQNYKLDNASCDSYTGEIWMGKSNTILDDLHLIHEFFHHLNLIPINKLDNKTNSLARELFGESISIMAQLDFVKKIKSDRLKDDAQAFEFDYINDSTDCAKKVLVELIMIDIFNKNGRIDEELIQEYISTCQDKKIAILVSQEYENVLSNIIGWGANFKFPFNLSYILGITLGYYLSDLVEKDNTKWKDIYYINENFYNLSIDEFLNILDINLQDQILLSNFLKHYQELKSTQLLEHRKRKK